MVFFIGSDCRITSFHYVHCAHRLWRPPYSRLLDKIYFIIFKSENFIFGHSFPSARFEALKASLLAGKLRPSSTKNILRFFVFLRLSLVVVLLKFIFYIYSMENLSFGHSVAIFSLCSAVACLLKSNLRPSLKISPPEIFFSSGNFSLVFISPSGSNKKNTRKGWAYGCRCNRSMNFFNIAC